MVLHASNHDKRMMSASPVNDAKKSDRIGGCAGCLGTLHHSGFNVLAVIGMFILSENSSAQLRRNHLAEEASAARLPPAVHFRTENPAYPTADGRNHGEGPQNGEQFLIFNTLPVISTTESPRHSAKHSSCRSSRKAMCHHGCCLTCCLKYSIHPVKQYCCAMAATLDQSRPTSCAAATLQPNLLISTTLDRHC